MDFSVHTSFVKSFTQWGPLREVQFGSDAKRKVKLEEKSSASSDITSHSRLGLTFWILLPWSGNKRCDQSRQKRRPRTVSPQLPLLASFQHLLKCSGWFLCSHPSFTKLFQSSFCLDFMFKRHGVVTVHSNFSGCMATSLWALCKYSRFSAGLLLLCVLHYPKVLSIPCVSHQQKVMWDSSIRNGMYTFHFHWFSFPYSIRVLSLKKEVCI